MINNNNEQENHNTLECIILAKNLKAGLPRPNPHCGQSIPAALFVSSRRRQRERRTSLRFL